MNAEETNVKGVFVLSTDIREDDRGAFARLFCETELADQGILFQVAQSSVSVNSADRTLRGLHYQSDEAPESKIVRCVHGAVWDVTVDLRPTSSSYLAWFGTELSSDNMQALVIPAGCAHGFLTLCDDAALLYMMDQAYLPDTACGVRWDDPAFSISWPHRPLIISERDATYPDYIAS